MRIIKTAHNLTFEFYIYLFSQTHGRLRMCDINGIKAMNFTVKQIILYVTFI